jgi:hypothetical protein
MELTEKLITFGKYKDKDIEELIQKVSESNLNVKYYALIIKELKRLLKATFNENLNEFLCAKNKRLRNRQGVQEIFHKYLDPFSFFLQAGRKAMAVAVARTRNFFMRGRLAGFFGISRHSETKKWPGRNA